MNEKILQQLKELRIDMRMKYIEASELVHILTREIRNIKTFTKRIEAMIDKIEKGAE